MKIEGWFHFSRMLPVVVLVSFVSHAVDLPVFVGQLNPQSSPPSSFPRQAFLLFGETLGAHGGG